LPASKLDVDQPVTNMGLDSLIALELRNRIQVDMDVRVPIVKLLHGPSIAELAVYLAALVAAEQSDFGSSVLPVPAVAAHTNGSASVVAQVEQMSDQEVDALLNKLIASRTSNA
jgi:acyl carrier protein